MKTLKRNLCLVAALVCLAGSNVPLHGTAKSIARETRTFQTVRMAEFLYDCVETLPATPERIVFGLMHEDENLEESCASQKKHSFIRSSNSPAFVKTLNLVNNALAKILQNKTAQSEALATIVLETTDEAFVVRFSFRRDSKASTRNNVRIAAQITTYGLTEELPPYFLNFLTALVLENTVMQNHAIKIIPAVALVVPAGMILNRVVRRHVRRSAASVRTRQPERAPAPATTENRRAPTAPQPQAQHAPAPATTQNRRAPTVPQPQETPTDAPLPPTAHTPLAREEMDILYETIFTIFNQRYTQEYRTVIGHSCRNLDKILRHRGGIPYLGILFSNGRTNENARLWDLFMNPHNGIKRRVKWCRYYGHQHVGPDERYACIIDHLGTVEYGNPTDERIPWTYHDHETENYQQQNYYH